MKYYSEEEMGSIRESLEREVLGWEGVRKRTMFGCPAYSAGTALFAFLVTGGIVLTRLGELEREDLVRREGGSTFRAGTRLVQGWIRIPVRAPAGLTRVLPHLRASYEAAGASPSI